MNDAVTKALAIARRDIGETVRVLFQREGCNCIEEPQVTLVLELGGALHFCVIDPFYGRGEWVTHEMSDLRTRVTAVVPAPEA